MSKRILIVSYHFYPDSEVGAKRVSELARYLCEQGMEVVVLAARSQRYIRSDPALTLKLPNLRLVTVPVPPKILPGLLKALKRLRPNGPNEKPRAPAAPADSGTRLRESWLARLRRYYFSLEWLVDDKKSWASLAVLRLWALALGKPFDAVISSGPPMTAHIATWLGRPLLRCPWVMDMRDPWFYDTNWRQEVQSGLSRHLNAALERRCASSADLIVTTTPGLAKILRERYPARREAVQVVFNGFNERLPLAPPPAGVLRLLYAGTLYYNRDPFPLLRAVAALARQPGVDRSKISFELVGNCASWGGVDIERWVQEQGVADCVKVRPPVPAREVPALMEQANVLVNFAQGQPNQIPAKMFDYISAGRDMLLIAETYSDSARLAMEAGCARVLEPEDESGLTAALTQLYQDYVVAQQAPTLDPARVQTFSRQSQNERFLELIDGCPQPVTQISS
jgi:glycosyltransferase involved in cell wall biosynthesis